MVGKIEVHLGEGIAGWVAQNRKPVLLKDISKDDRFSDRQGRMDYKTRSVLSVPILLHENQLLGVLNVNNKRNGDEAFQVDAYGVGVDRHSDGFATMADVEMYVGKVGEVGLAVRRGGKGAFGKRKAEDLLQQKMRFEAGKLAESVLVTECLFAPLRRDEGQHALHLVIGAETHLVEEEILHVSRFR